MPPIRATATILDDEGTITLPQAVVDALDLRPGDTLRYILEGPPDRPCLRIEKATNGTTTPPTP